MRLRLLAIAVAIWSFVLNLLLQKGWLNWVPDWAVVAALLVPIMIWGWLGLTHHEFQRRVRRTKPVVALIIFVIVGAIIGGASGAVLFQIISRDHTPEAKGQTSKSDEAKKQPFIIDDTRGNCIFFTLSTSDARLSGRKGLSVYDIKIVNNTGGSTTLKEVLLGYEHRNENVKRERLGTVLPAGKLKDGKPAMILFSPIGTMLLSSWQDIRLVIGENQEKVPGAIWRGSGVFIFDEDVKSFDDVVNPRLIARDYLNQESERSISPISRTDFEMRDEPFVQESDNSFRWVKREQ